MKYTPLVFGAFVITAVFGSPLEPGLLENGRKSTSETNSTYDSFLTISLVGTGTASNTRWSSQHRPSSQPQNFSVITGRRKRAFIGNPEDDFSPIPPSVRSWWLEDAYKFMTTYVRKYESSFVYADLGLTSSIIRCIVEPARESRSAGTLDPACKEIYSNCDEKCRSQAKLVGSAASGFLSLMDLVAETIGAAFFAAGRQLSEMPYAMEWWKDLNNYQVDDKHELHSVSQQALEGLPKHLVQDTLLSVILTAIPWKQYDEWLWDADDLVKHANARKIETSLTTHSRIPPYFSSRKSYQFSRTGLRIANLNDGNLRRAARKAAIEAKSSVRAQIAREFQEARNIQAIIYSEDFQEAHDSSWWAFYWFVKHVTDQITTEPGASDWAGKKKTQFQKSDKNGSGEIAFRKLLGDTASEASFSIQRAAPPVLAGSFVTSRYDHPMLLEILRLGNIPAAPSRRYKETFVEDLKERVINLILSIALRKDRSWISCTDEFMRSGKRLKDRNPQAACHADNSGPRNAKACLGRGKNEVCYLYTWRSDNNHGKNVFPAGFADWEPKYNIAPRDIIISSVDSYNGPLTSYRLFSNYTPLSNSRSLPLPSLGLASEPGAFAIPVCFTPYNWNAQVSKSDFIFCPKSNPFCRSTTLPCHCGRWGSETRNVWDAVGLPFDDYRLGTTCSQQIAKKIRDPLERYVAYCRLGVQQVSPNKGGSSKNIKKGKDENCDTIIALMMASRRENTSGIDPVVLAMIGCRVLDKGGQRCKMHQAKWKEYEAAVREGRTGDLVLSRSGDRIED